MPPARALRPWARDLRRAMPPTRSRPSAPVAPIPASRMRRTSPGSLRAVLSGRRAAGLIDSYDVERCAAADENIGHSTRSTDFIAPRSPQERRFRDAALALARHTGFAKRLVNSGRLSAPSSPTRRPFRPRTSSRGPARRDWRARAGCAAARPAAGRPGSSTRSAARRRSSTSRTGQALPCAFDFRTLVVGGDLADADGFFGKRFDASPGGTYLVRPDQHLAARWRRADAALIGQAWQRMCGHETR